MTTDGRTPAALEIPRPPAHHLSALTIAGWRPAVEWWGCDWAAP
ncbi:hypothetical protein [Micromonospora sp. NPDC048839]